MNNKGIPIAIPTIIPIINPISKSESDVSLKLVIWSLFEISTVALSGSVSWVEFPVSTTMDFGRGVFSEVEIVSDKRFVNFALSVIGSVVEFPANNVEWVKSEYVPVWLIGTFSTVDVLSLFFTG